MSRQSSMRQASIPNPLQGENVTVGPDGVQEITRYVEVPVVEEVLRTIPKRECVEVEKRTDRQETEFLDRIVEVPQVRKVTKIVEVPHFQEVVKTITRREVVPVPKEVVKYVTRKEARVVEKEERVKGEIVEVPKVVDVIKEVIVPRYHDTEVPIVVAQTIVPVVTDEGAFERIEAVTYEPQMTVVDVYIPKPVDRPVVCLGKTREDLQPVNIPAPQYNLILRNLNANIIHHKIVYRDMPFRTEADGSIHFLNHTSTGAESTETSRTVSGGITTTTTSTTGGGGGGGGSANSSGAAANSSPARLTPSNSRHMMPNPSAELWSSQ